ncbi:uncharacterized protein Dwil_GK26940 [Drosophila willistoni]|uniref:BPTI/Kunitz inhibitor domain-containing protein n=2 Tax=Drosophila willistoni TaxID=7260 RepID=A0A0Q9X0D9_DROWI|nr:uncharacterized protein Dwil_GK26940 [Drosophila willistoni]
MKLLLSLMLLLVAAIATVSAEDEAQAEAKAAAASQSSSASGVFFGNRYRPLSKYCQQFEKSAKSSYPICEIQYFMSPTYKRCRFTCKLSRLM